MTQSLMGINRIHMFDTHGFILPFVMPEVSRDPSRHIEWCRLLRKKVFAIINTCKNNAEITRNLQSPLCLRMA